MEKRYQVFVSSTYTDLQEERLKVMQTLMRLDCIPAGMELFPAIDTEQFEYIKRIIDDSDYYILIIGGRYGSLSEDGISYTEKEYDYAVSKKIPVMAFLHDDISKLTVEKSDIDQEKRDKLITFRDKVSKTRLIEYWNNPNDLSSKVVLSLVSTIKLFPAVGWVRANLQTNTESLQEINNLRKKIETLKQEKEDLLNNISTTSQIADIAELDEVIIVSGSNYTTRSGRTKWELTLTWERLFAIISPFFLECHTDSRAQDIISEALAKEAKSCQSYPSIDTQDFQTIKVQFMALGLIDVERRKTTKGGYIVGWQLTESGINYMKKLRVVKTSK